MDSLLNCVKRAYEIKYLNNSVFWRDFRKNWRNATGYDIWN